MRKNLLLKTAEHSKTRDFSARQDEKTRQGCRLPCLFDAVLRKNIRFGAYKSLCATAFGELFIFVIYWNFTVFAMAINSLSKSAASLMFEQNWINQKASWLL